MKIYFSLLIVAVVYFTVKVSGQTYVGSTPAHEVVRRFLRISLTDSLDFIRWKVELGAGSFKLQCHYGLAKGGTPGFTNDQSVALEGTLLKKENYYYLGYRGRKISLLKVNMNLFHFLDGSNHMLIGNGGHSYALNNITPIKTNEFNIQPIRNTIKTPLVFEGRTPCQELSSLLHLHKRQVCNKLKWYFIFYADSITGKPLYYLKNGIGYRKETMARGKWQIITKDNGRILYQVQPDDGTYTLYLLKGDDNILFFTDGNGRLLVGNEDFSYTLNRRKEEYARMNE